MTLPSVDKDVKGLEFSYIASGSMNWCKHFGKLAIFLNTHLLQDWVNPVLSIWRKGITPFHKKSCTLMFISLIYNSLEFEKTPEVHLQINKLCYIQTTEYYSIIKGTNYYLQQPGWISKPLHMLRVRGQKWNIYSMYIYMKF